MVVYQPRDKREYRLAYRDTSIEGRFLHGELDAVATVIRWIAVVVASPRFWSLRPDWQDHHQEVMRRVIESLRTGRFDDTCDFRTYVQAVARYTMIQALNTQQRRHLSTILDEQRLPAVPATDSTLLDRELARVALQESSGDCRELLKAYFFDERSYVEIAEHLKVPVGTVKSRLARCLEKVGGVLESHRSARISEKRTRSSEGSGG